MTYLIAESAPFDWNNFVTLLIAVFVAWNTYRSRQRDKEVADAKLAQEAAKVAQEATKAVVEKVAERVVSVAEKVEVIHKETNSMKDALVEATKQASKAEGKQEERTEERQRVDDKAAAEKAPAAAESPTEVVVVNEPHDPVPTTTAKPAKL